VLRLARNRPARIEQHGFGPWPNGALLALRIVADSVSIRLTIRLFAVTSSNAFNTGLRRLFLSRLADWTRATDFDRIDRMRLAS